MTDQAVPIGGTGFKAYTLEYTISIGGTPTAVQVEPIVIADPTDPTIRAPIQNGGLSVFPVGATMFKATKVVNTAGVTIVRAPASGKKLRVKFFGFSAGADVTGVLAQMKLDGYDPGDGTGAGAVFDQQFLTTPGQPYARNIQAGNRYIEGAVDGKLKINLSAAQTVYVNYEVEEV